jgi:hypothetical protein
MLGNQIQKWRITAGRNPTIFTRQGYLFDRGVIRGNVLRSLFARKEAPVAQETRGNGLLDRCHLTG